MQIAVSISLLIFSAVRLAYTTGYSIKFRITETVIVSMFLEKRYNINYGGNVIK